MRTGVDTVPAPDTQIVINFNDIARPVHTKLNRTSGDAGVAIDTLLLVNPNYWREPSYAVAHVPYYNKTRAEAIVRTMMRIFSGTVNAISAALMQGGTVPFSMMSGAAR
jgi:hypothetical protein